MSPSRAEIERLTEEFVQKIGEHCDASQVLVTWNEEGTTASWRYGGGNWFARQGMAHDFIKTSESQTTAHEIGRVMTRQDPPEEETFT